MRLLKTIGLYAGCVLLIMIACCGEVYHMRPFGYGVALGLCAYLHPLPLLAGLLAGELLVDFSMYTAVEVGVFVAVLCPVCMIRKKRAFPAYVLFLVASVGSLGRAYAVSAARTMAFTAILCVLFTLLTGTVGFTALKPIVVHKLKYRLLEPELAALGLLAAIYGVSFSACTLYGFNPAVTAALALSAVLAYTSGSGAATVTAVCFGLGISLGTFNVGYLAAMALAAATLSFFAAAPKLICGLSGALGFIMAAYLFDTFGGQAPMLALSATVGAVVYALIPMRVLKLLATLLSGGRKPAVRYLINRARYELAAELDDTAVVFAEMGCAIDTPEPERRAETGGALRSRVCDECSARASCQITDADADCLMNGVMKAGHASVNELPKPFVDHCSRLAAVIGTADAMYRSAKEAERRRAGSREARQMIGEHYAGISALLKDMGRRTAVMVDNPNETEERITEELTYRNVVCGETLLSGEGDDQTVTMVVRADTVQPEIIERTLYKILKRSFALKVSESGLGGFAIVYATTRPRLDVLFAAASKPKEGKSGDTHSFTRIGRRFMMALSDGMGSGEQAYRTSETAIGLVENFYRAGFDDTVILKSVNKFLSLGADESFSAVDIATIDLENGDADVIKIGAPPAYIKNEDTVTVVRGEALPLGITEEMRPTVVRRRLRPGETVVFVSDGVSDCFDGDELADFINALPPHNPQSMADSVIKRAAEKGGHPDDMTVVCARIILRDTRSDFALRPETVRGVA